MNLKYVTAAAALAVAMLGFAAPPVSAQNAEGVIYSFDYLSSTPLPGLPILGTLGIRMILE